ncbi:MAG: hypothetical protein M3N46_12895 [Actinomycetota bacterium]|nr:hypothetical protein [Actinomycetota bacterium]
MGAGGFGAGGFGAGVRAADGAGGFWAGGFWARGLVDAAVADRVRLPGFEPTGFVTGLDGLGVAGLADRACPDLV